MAPGTVLDTAMGTASMADQATDMAVAIGGAISARIVGVGVDQVSAGAYGATAAKRVKYLHSTLRLGSSNFLASRHGSSPQSPDNVAGDLGGTTKAQNRAILGVGICQQKAKFAAKSGRIYLGYKSLQISWLRGLDLNQRHASASQSSLLGRPWALSRDIVQTDPTAGLSPTDKAREGSRAGA